MNSKYYSIPYSILNKPNNYTNVLNTFKIGGANAFQNLAHDLNYTFQMPEGGESFQTNFKLFFQKLLERAVYHDFKFL